MITILLLSGINNRILKLKGNILPEINSKIYSIESTIESLHREIVELQEQAANDETVT